MFGVNETSPQPTTKGAVMRKNLSIALMSFVLLAGASTFLSACNTVEGAGRDVSKAGGAITEEAKEHK
jgi:predicted small secreted protein